MTVITVVRMQRRVERRASSVGRGFCCCFIVKTEGMMRGMASVVSGGRNG